jgi:hypothetical protein
MASTGDGAPLPWCSAYSTNVLVGEVHGEPRPTPSASWGDVAAMGGAADAEGYYRQALALAEPRGMRPLVAHCHFGLGKLHYRAGNPERAQEDLTIAMAMYREMDMPYLLEQATAEMCKLG